MREPDDDISAVRYLYTDGLLRLRRPLFHDRSSLSKEPLRSLSCLLNNDIHTHIKLVPEVPPTDFAVLVVAKKHLNASISS